MSAPKQEQRPALIDLQATADFLGVPLAAIRRWHLRGTAPTGFPSPIHYGQRVAYRRAEVEAWALGNTVPRPAPATPTSSEPTKRPRGRPRKQSAAGV